MAGLLDFQVWNIMTLLGEEMQSVVHGAPPANCLNSNIKHLHTEGKYGYVLYFHN